MAAMNILLVDDHPIFRAGMTSILQDVFPDAKIAEIGDAQGLNAATTNAILPDLLMVDLFFPGFDYRKDLPRLRQKLPLTPIVAISMMNDIQEIEAIIAMGLNGFISKAVSPAEVKQSLGDIMQGEIAICTCDDVLGHNQPHVTTGLENLTARQIEILRLLRKGLSNKEIARELDLSPFTVRTHVSAVLRTLGVSSRSAASALAASHGLAAR